MHGLSSASLAIQTCALRSAMRLLTTSHRGLETSAVFRWRPELHFRHETMDVENELFYMMEET